MSAAPLLLNTMPCDRCGADRRFRLDGGRLRCEVCRDSLVEQLEKDPLGGRVSGTVSPRERRGPAPERDVARSADRFWSRVQFGPGCWEWMSFLSEKGYGYFTIGSRLLRAHRLSFEMCHDTRIPDGMVVMHTCDNRKCVRPDHLRLGTGDDNVADRVAKNRSAAGERNGSARLTLDQVCEIRNAPTAQSALSLARHYGVSENTIRAIRTGKRWRQVSSDDVATKAGVVPVVVTCRGDDGGAVGPSSDPGAAASASPSSSSLGSVPATGRPQDRISSSSNPGAADAQPTADLREPPSSGRILADTFGEPVGGWRR